MARTSHATLRECLTLPRDWNGISNADMALLRKLIAEVEEEAAV